MAGEFDHPDGAGVLGSLYDVGEVGQVWLREDVAGIDRAVGVVVEVARGLKERCGEAGEPQVEEDDLALHLVRREIGRASVADIRQRRLQPAGADGPSRYRP
jgi:hypothetical protein